MKKWDYKVALINKKRLNKGEETLKYLGEEGWELVAVKKRHGEPTFIAYLKKPIS